ncbi:hydroxymethylglutaryl-CoA lyase [uncultured Massilia sp.]|uniref:hydroxymethylglutaryl-CoA lyase n=1 Tax=uncultured Massilia sp. TaxID=169973 RepID=UPI0025FBEF2F|nr:hydroxymethylglutaryl-CoA lyase [uncultured Massilia sp.]
MKGQGRMPAAVRLVEVGPRDGLQAEKTPVPTAVKVALIERLGDTGLTTIEATSFVSPRAVPQMADHADVMRLLRRRADVAYPVLVPNLKGWEQARQAGVSEIAVFISASEAFSRANLNCTIAASLERVAAVAAAALAQGVRVRGYISCVLGCPFEGHVAPSVVARLARALADLGCYEISLGDTIGTGTPGATRDMVELVAGEVGIGRLAGHFHDTYGQALANIHAALQAGMTVFDASVAGLGGCPYAPGATGNVATEDVVYMLHGMGIATGVDLDKLRAVGDDISRHLGRPSQSRVARALAARRAA